MGLDGAQAGWVGWGWAGAHGVCVSKFPPLLDRYPHPASHPLPTALLSGDWAELEVDTREQGDNAPTPKGKKEKAYVWLSYLRR